jgi:eukaryotic-like serine/threonine-protein kinase
MSFTSSEYKDSDAPFAEFLRAISEADDPQRVLLNYIESFPQLEAKLRQLFDFNLALDSSQSPSPPPRPLKLGEFKIVRLITVGGMGEIYEAYHARLDRRVALKIVRRGWSSIDARERFVREQHILAQLHHTHIVPIHTGGEDESIQYFTMPYIHGAALNHVVRAAASQSAFKPSGGTPSVLEIVNQVVDVAPPIEERRSETMSPESSDSALTCLPKRLSHSRKYLISVAKTLIDVAEAVDYAHSAGVLHRDLKPGNVMIEPDGHCWIIDFGLAARICSSDGNDLERAHHCSDPRLSASLTQQRGGTPSYMSPERWRGQPADQLSDVFSLGAILYELLTLRRAFDGNNSTEIKTRILSGKKTPARMFVDWLPKDLDAIADKAMSLVPASRYQSAGDFAKDLQRWLACQPTKARPPMPLRRFWMWTLRKPAIAATLLLAILGSSGAVAAIVDSFAKQTIAANLLAKESRRVSLMQDLQYRILGEHNAGWSKDNWELVRTIGAMKSTSELRDHAAATLKGPDAHLLKSLEFVPTTVVYDLTGRRVLMARTEAEDPKNIGSSSHRQIVRVWDSETDELSELKQRIHQGYGEIAFRDDGVPLQLVWDDDQPNAVLVWDMVAQRELRRLDCPFALNQPPLAWSMAAGGTAAAVLARDPEGRSQVFVWQAESQFQAALFSSAALMIKISPDGSLVASTTENGRIEVWSVEQRKIIAKFSVGHANITCMAWTKDCLKQVNDESIGWLLAAGSAGGDIAIWDVEHQIQRSTCIGSHYDVSNLAFSPDGMTLASVGRDFPMLWAVASGRLILRLGYSNYMNSVSFSPDGKRIAVGKDRELPHGAIGGVEVWEIDAMRGQQTLHGLRAPVSLVCISSDRRFVAALAQNWQLAVWDLQSHRLLYTFETPKGIFANSAGLAIDRDGRRVAVAAGPGAKVWDTFSGNQLVSVELPEGFQDSVAFRNPNSLVLVRQESINPKDLPYGYNPTPESNPRVCRVRDLLSSEPKRPFLELKDFKRSAARILLSPDGQRLLIEGFDEPGEIPEHRMIKLYDLPEGTKRWELESAYVTAHYRIGLFDTTSRFFTMQDEAFKVNPLLFEVDSRRLVRALRFHCKGLGPEARINISDTDSNDPALPKTPVLVRSEDEDFLLALRGTGISTDFRPFSEDGSLIAWGNFDGTVTIFDVQRVRKKLAEVGLGW